MEEPTETRPAGAEDLANGAREPEGPPPEVEEEEVEEEAKAALGSECKRRVELGPPSRSRPVPRREICAVVGTDPSIRRRRLFFSESAGELRLIILRRKMG